MFETAVKADSEVSVVHGGSQQNGAILGNGCSLFLAKFICKLIHKYNELCLENKKSPSDSISASLYRTALNEALIHLSIEDMREHGRLLLLKEKLVGLAGSKEKVDTQLLSLFQLKDFCRNDPAIQKELEEKIRAGKEFTTSGQIIKAIDYRQSQMVFPNAKLIQEGGDNIDGSIDSVREAILAKQGIVDESSQEDFRFFVKNCMSKQSLDLIGGQFSSFSKKSFRLYQLNQ